MTIGIRITMATDTELDYVVDQLVEYNSSQVPFTQDPSFVPLNFILRDPEGQIIGGIKSMLYCWGCLAVAILWVDETHRGKGYGSTLLLHLESAAKEAGAHLSQLDTFDFQAKDFYLKHGYEVFGVLKDCPKDHERYYLKKVL